MFWENKANHDALSWLLEEENPGVRYLALRDLQGCSPDDPALAAARGDAHTKGPIATILATMNPEGYWSEPGPGYTPKYFSSVWALILLAQLGASLQEDERIGYACAYLLDHALAEGGQFAAGKTKAPSGTADCLQGNLCTAMLDLGCADKRLHSAFEWMARSVTGEGVAPMEDRHASVRYYAGKCGPNFACGANNKLPCAWGAVKVMLALSKLPPAYHTPVIDRAIEAGVQFLFSTDPAIADYPSGYSSKPSGNWWKFGFPVFYVTDLLQNVEALVALGYGKDPRLAAALEIVQQKQDAQGRWLLDYHYTGKTLADFGPARKPNKWVTWRALKVLHALS